MVSAPVGRVQDSQGRVEVGELLLPVADALFELLYLAGHRGAAILQGVDGVAVAVLG